MTETLTRDAVVWTEIPVRNLDKARAFYAAVLDCEMPVQQMGPNLAAIFPAGDKNGVSGNLYEGEPAKRGSGPTVHLAVADGLDAALQRVRDAGGSVVSEPIDIPSGRFAYCLDPDGNSIGLFQS